MTSTADVEALHMVLDANPADHEARLRLSDAYADAGEDDLAEGYRALAMLKKYPDFSYLGWFSRDKKWSWFSCYGTNQSSNLHYHWREEIEINSSDRQFEYFIRREAEDAAALAFCRLPVHRKAELLAAAEGAVSPETGLTRAGS